MSDLLSSLEALRERRSSRRNLLKTAVTGALGLAGAGLLAKGAEAVPVAPPPPGGLDAAVLNFALNLEYVEAEYYLHATTGMDLAANGYTITGTGTFSGEPTPKVLTKSASTLVPFASSEVKQYATEITADEASHVKFIQTALTKFGLPFVARPKIDLLNSFSSLGALIGAPGFDPFASDLDFLLGAYIFEDVGVTAYKGGSRLLANHNIVEYAAGILAVEAYHASLIRTNLFEAGPMAQMLTQKISDVRNTLGGNSIDSNGNSVPPDAGVVAPTAGGGTTSNIVLTDSNSIAFSRTTTQVLKIVYADNGTKPVPAWILGGARRLPARRRKRLHQVVITHFRRYT